MTDDIVAQLLQTRKLIKQLQEKEQDMIDWLQADDNFQWYKWDDAIIKKYVSRSTVLKQGIEQEQMMEKFPEAVVTKASLDMKLLGEIPGAHEYLELKESDRLSITLK